MAELSSPFSCDICGVHKREGNHWFRVWLATGYRGVVVVAPWSMKPETALPAAGGFYFHCCGEEHAIRKAGQLLGMKSTAAALPTE